MKENENYIISLEELIEEYEEDEPMLTTGQREVLNLYKELLKRELNQEPKWSLSTFPSSLNHL